MLRMRDLCILQHREFLSREDYNLCRSVRECEALHLSTRRMLATFEIDSNVGSFDRTLASVYIRSLEPTWDVIMQCSSRDLQLIVAFTIVVGLLHEILHILVSTIGLLRSIHTTKFLIAGMVIVAAGGGKVQWSRRSRMLCGPR